MLAKLLVIDDEKDMVETIKQALATRGYEVISAYNGEDGLKKAKEENPDLVICDVKMPKVDGWEVLKRLRKDFAKWIPVIMLTVLKDVSSVKKGYEHEADYYVTKPFRVEELLEGIRIILSLRPARDKDGDAFQQK